MVFRSAEYVLGDYFGVLRHVEALEKILSQIIVCSSVMNIPGVFRPGEYVSGDYFRVPRHGDAQEMILSEIIVCSSVLNKPRVFLNR